MPIIDLTNLFKLTFGSDTPPQPKEGTPPVRKTTPNTGADALHIQTKPKPKPATTAEGTSTTGISSSATKQVSPLFAEFDHGNPFTQE